MQVWPLLILGSQKLKTMKLLTHSPVLYSQLKSLYQEVSQIP